MVQIRLPDGTMLDPDRDLRYAYQQAVRMVKAHFEAEAWPDLVKMVEAAGVTWDDLTATLNSYVDFLNNSSKDCHQDLQAVLTEAGWFAQPPLAQMAIMAMLGRVVTGQFFYAIRSTTPLGEPPRGMDVVMRQAIVSLSQSMDGVNSPLTEENAPQT